MWVIVKQLCEYVGLLQYHTSLAFPNLMMENMFRMTVICNMRKQEDVKAVHPMMQSAGIAISCMQKVVQKPWSTYPSCVSMNVLAQLLHIVMPEIWWVQFEIELNTEYWMVNVETLVCLLCQMSSVHLLHWVWCTHGSQWLGWGYAAILLIPL